MSFVMPTAEPASLHIDPEPIDRMRQMIRKHIDDGRYPGAQIALARDGKLALYESFGRAGLAPSRDANDDTLWLLFSNTKVITACAIWMLIEDGALRFTDAVADHLPEFAANGKGDITILDLLTHRGGFPNASVPQAAWEDHELLRRAVCDFSLEWTPRSRVFYHSGSAHWTAAVLIEALTGQDFRDFIRARVIEPLGVGEEMFVGLPASAQPRAADIHEPDGESGAHRAIADRNTSAAMAAGIPGGGGYASARAMVAFYQMLAGGGRLGKRRLLSQRTVEYVTRNHTGDSVDENFEMPMHRGVGPHVRGLTANIRGLGSLAHPRTFGHGGVGSSYCWADPESGVSFAYLSNSKVPEPWHSIRMDLISNFAHMAIAA